MYGSQWEALQLHVAYKNIFYYKSCENLHQYWVKRVHEGTYDKTIITIVPSYTKKTSLILLPLALLLVLHTHNNTDGNKLVIFPVQLCIESIIIASHHMSMVTPVYPMMVNNTLVVTWLTVNYSSALCKQHHRQCLVYSTPSSMTWGHKIVCPQTVGFCHCTNCF